MATARDIAQVLSMLDEAFESKPHHDQKVRIELYHRALLDLDGELLKAAVLQIICERVYPTLPTIGEIRQMVYSISHRGELSAEEAWAVVQQAMKRHGSYGSPSQIFEDDKILRAVNALGWREMCLTDADQLGVTRAHFMRIYGAFAEREKQSEMMLPEVRALAQLMSLDKRLRLRGGDER